MPELAMPDDTEGDMSTGLPRHVSLFMSNAQVDWLDAQAERSECKRAHIIRLCVDAVRREAEIITEEVARRELDRLKVENRKLKAESEEWRRKAFAASQRKRRVDVDAARKALDAIPSDTLLLSEVQAVLNLSYHAVYHIIRRGEIKASGISGQRKIKKADVVAYLEGFAKLK